MVILYLFASILGALTTFIVLSSQGWLVALLCAYLGGSALALIIAIAVFVLRAKEGIVDQNVADAGPSMSLRPAPAPVDLDGLPLGPTRNADAALV